MIDAADYELGKKGLSMTFLVRSLPCGCFCFIDSFVQPCYCYSFSSCSSSTYICLKKKNQLYIYYRPEQLRETSFLDSLPLYSCIIAVIIYIQIHTIRSTSSPSSAHQACHQTPNGSDWQHLFAHPTPPPKSTPSRDSSGTSYPQ